MSRYQAAYDNAAGPGDARPTALQIVQDEGLVGKLTDKVIFVTGGNQGLGLETVRALHATGATVYFSVRDLKQGQKAIDDVLSSSKDGKKDSLRLIQLSLDSLESVRSAARAFLAQSSKLNILILNAGVMATPEGKTVDGFETQFGVNHLGHFLLFQLLKPTLLASSTPSFNSRVVSVASSGHRYTGIRFDDVNFEKPGSYNPFMSYGQSKTANIYLANEIERRYGHKGLHGLSLHPGGILTNLARYIDPAIIENLSKGDADISFIMSAPQGAATSVYAAISKEWEGRGGRYLGNCVEQGPETPGSVPSASDGFEIGYAPWVYDEEKAAKLWELSLELLKIKETD